jgi:hypothetical protein
MPATSRPTPRQYLDRVLDALQSRLSITEKLEDSLVLALALASQEGVYAFDDTLMYGLIVGRSSAVHILDSAGIDVTAYSYRLRSNLLGYDPNSECPFAEEYDGIGSAEDPGGGTQLYKALVVASAIARANHQPAIDSSSFLLALFRGARADTRRDGDQELERIATMPVSEYLRRELAAGGQASSGIEGLEEIETFLAEREAFDSLPFAALSPYVSRLSDFARLEDSIRFANTVEPYIENRRFALISDQQGVHLRQFDYLNSYGCRDERGQVGCKINLCSGGGVIAPSHVEEFDSLINRSDVSEYDVQKFFEAHPSFLLGSQYHRLHSQVALTSDTGTKLIPDFFAERVGTTFADIIELKKPSEKLVSGSGSRRGMAVSVTRALSQLREYRNYFDDISRRREFHRRYGFEAFRPAIIVVIGRSSSYLDQLERISIEDEYKHLQLLTYDDILLRAKRMTINV